MKQSSILYDTKESQSRLKTKSTWMDSSRISPLALKLGN